MNIGYISLYGFVGTFISFVVLSSLTFLFDSKGTLEELLDPGECLLLACVLSATDTVAAVSIVKEEKY